MRVPFVKDGLRFAIPLAVVVVLLGAWRLAAGAAALVPLAFVLWFFRDPARTSPAESGILISPADGRVLPADGGKISIFLSVFNVHVCRSPVAGRVGSVKRTPGRFVAAFRDDASEHNERTALEIRDVGANTVRLTLVAGLIARRIVTWVRAEQDVAAGERLGIIRFGSRVDLELPEGYRATVEPGAKVKAGETIVARRT